MILPIGLLCLWLAPGAPLPAPTEEPRVFYLVRHAERADDSRDADLSEKGFRRAKELARFLTHIPVEAIYATTYQRTQKTVSPLARQKDLNIQILDAGATDRLADKLRGGKERMAVVAGHSNTIPQLIQTLGCGQVTIDHDEYDNVFLLILTGQTCTLQRFHFPME